MTTEILDLPKTQTEKTKIDNIPVSQTHALNKILDKALANDVDLDRLERLLALRDKEIERHNYENFVSDLSAMQIEYQNISKNTKNTHTNSTCATLDQYIDAVKDTLSKYRFALFSHIKDQTHDHIIIEMTLTHPSGNKISTHGRFPIDVKGCKSNIQSIGSTITYARRYLLGMLLNVASAEEDTDGNPTEISKLASSERLKEINRLIKDTNSETEKVLSFAKVQNLTDMSEKKAQIVLEHLKKKQQVQDIKHEPIKQEQEAAV
ncbi:ERF family protein [Bartonella sp. B23]